MHSAAVFTIASSELNLSVTSTRPLRRGFCESTILRKRKSASRTITRRGSSLQKTPTSNSCRRKQRCLSMSCSATMPRWHNRYVQHDRCLPSRALGAQNASSVRIRGVVELLLAPRSLDLAHQQLRESRCRESNCGSNLIEILLQFELRGDAFKIVANERRPIPKRSGSSKHSRFRRMVVRKVLLFSQLVPGWTFSLSLPGPYVSCMSSNVVLLT